MFKLAILTSLSLATSYIRMLLIGSGGGCVGSLTEQGLSVVGRLRKLTALNVSYLDMANNTSLTNITTRNTRLREIVCRGCPQLGDEGSSQ